MLEEFLKSFSGWEFSVESGSEESGFIDGTAESKENNTFDDFYASKGSDGQWTIGWGNGWGKTWASEAQV